VTRQRTGDVLILMGALTEEERLYYVGQQIKSILYSVFAWEEGSYTLSFQARARKEAIKLDIHPANLIMRGVKKLYKADRLKRLMPDSARPIPCADPSFNLSDVELTAWEAHLLPRCDGNRSVAELVRTSGKPENEVLGTMVGLTSLRVLDLR
jgi:two-component system OmpR family response regulator